MAIFVITSSGDSIGIDISYKLHDMSASAPFGAIYSERFDQMHVVYHCLTHLAVNHSYNLDILTI